MFKSVAKIAGQRAVGVLLTGMGKDGAAGLLAMKKQGAKTYAQDETSSIVFGMPKEALRIGAASEAIPLNQIALKISQALSM
jgi:two-component system chemotaxis response regulator CheB